MKKKTENLFSELVSKSKKMKIEYLKKDSSESFSMLAGINRPIIPSHVTKIAKSHDMMGCVRPVVICIISFINGIATKFIVDGQHLFHALLRNNADIPYITIEIKNQVDLIEKIAMLNASSKSWGLIDYVTAWASVSDDYKKLNGYFDRYDFDLQLISGILSNGSVRGASSTYVVTPLKGGKFKIVNEKQNVKILDYLTDILKIIPRGTRINNQYVYREFVDFYRTSKSSYNHIKFLLALKKHKAKFIYVVQQEQKLKDLYRSILLAA